MPRTIHVHMHDDNQRDVQTANAMIKQVQNMARDCTPVAYGAGTALFRERIRDLEQLSTMANHTAKALAQAMG